MMLRLQRCSLGCVGLALSCPLRRLGTQSATESMPIFPLHERPQSSLLTPGNATAPPMEPLMEQRASRRRFSKANTEGRSHFITRIMERLQTMRQLKKRRRKGGGDEGSNLAPDDALLDIEKLHPRVKLDLLRRLRIKERALRIAQNPSPLPKFYSVLFRKKYFFKEEDLVEDFTKGRGPGGQATNRRKQTAIVHHKPSGIIVRHSKWPSLWLNRRAARELVHMRLEEKILGARSQLGRERARNVRRQRQRRDTFGRLERRGKRARKMAARLFNFRSILRCNGPFPNSLRHTITSLLVATSPNTDQIATVRGPSQDVVSGLDCLLNDQCHMWWPVLAALSSSGSGAVGLDSFMQCVFPVVDSASHFDAFGLDMLSCRDERDAYQQLVACRADPSVLANVRRAFICLMEVCGILRCEVSGKGADGEVQPKLELRRDADAWRLCHSRWIDDSTNSIKPWMRGVLPHVFVSLLQLGCKPEAAAIKRFFVKETKRHEAAATANAPATVSNDTGWAREGLALLNKATRDLIVLPQQPPREGR